MNLRCYVVIELKTGEFKPEYAGQLKNGFLLAFNALRNQGFSFLSAELMHIKTLRMRNYYFYGKTLFEHSFFINVPCRLLQMPVVSCISRSDADGGSVPIPVFLKQLTILRNHRCPLDTCFCHAQKGQLPQK